jgi:hypothetical protein
MKLFIDNQEVVIKYPGFKRDSDTTGIVTAQVKKRDREPIERSLAKPGVHMPVKLQTNDMSLSATCQGYVVKTEEHSAYDYIDYWLQLSVVDVVEMQSVERVFKEVHLVARFPAGARVRYIPLHAQGNPYHPDCEDGEVSSCNDKFVFVRFGNKTTAQSCDPEDLRLLSDIYGKELPDGTE